MLNLHAVESSGIHAEKLQQTTQSWDGSDLPDFTGTETQVSMLKITIDPGARLPLHKHPVINAGMLLEGELTVETEAGATTHLQAGDTLVEVVNTWHYGRNEGSVPAVIFVVYVGGKDEPLTISKSISGEWRLVDPW